MRDDAPVRLPAPDRHIHYPSAGATLYAAGFGPRHGTPLVMLHGGLADHRAALLRAAPLADTTPLVTPDLRGCGRSPAAGRLSFAALADDLAALLDHLDAPRAVVGGISAGCAVAVAFALRHPDRCAGLALVTPAHGGAALGLTPTQAESLRAMHAHAEAARRDGVDVLLALYDPLPAPVRAIARQMARGFDLDAVVHHTALLASGAQPFDDPAALAAIDAPALLVPGDDAHHPAAASAVYARHLRRCEVQRGDPIDPALRALVDRARG